MAESGGTEVELVDFSVTQIFFFKLVISLIYL